MTAIDQLRALPARIWVGVALVIALISTVAIVAAGGGSGDLATAGSVPVAVTPSSTERPAEPSARVAASTEPSPSTSTTAPARSTTVPTTTIDVDTEFEIVFDEDDPAVSARPIPEDPDPDEAPPVTVAPPAWAASTFATAAGHISTDIGCADDLSAAALDRFFAARLGPVLGWDYQHVYPLDGGRYLWVFQDAFVDHSGTASTFAAARFVHNVAAVQEGSCFRLLHRGSAARPKPFEEGDGTGGTRTKWYWPMGGEVADGQLWVFWVEMVKDPYDPDPPNGLGWHPNRTWLGAYDLATLERTAFFLAPASGVAPIYGYAVSSDATHTYLFGNTFEQNLLREGGFWNGPHSATQMWLARVPRGKVAAAPEYRTADGWSPTPTDAVPILSRFWAENPMQPRYLDGQWVAATAVDGYWGDLLAVDVADQPWGPWSTIVYEPLLPRGADPKMNTYHAQPLPWRDGFGSVIITVSNNARNMLRDAWGNPHRYRPAVLSVPFQPTPTTTTTTTTTTTVGPTTVAPTTTTTSTSTTTTTTSTTTTTTTSTSTTTSTTTVPPTTAASTTTPSSTAPSTTAPSTTAPATTLVPTEPTTPLAAGDG